MKKCSVELFLFLLYEYLSIIRLEKDFTEKGGSDTYKSAEAKRRSEKESFNYTCVLMFIESIGLSSPSILVLKITSPSSLTHS